MTRLNPHRRLACETYAMSVVLGEGKHDLAVSLAYDNRGVVREVTFVGRGKIGHGLDGFLSELGIGLSRAMQGRDPDTGKPTEPVSDTTTVR